MKVRKAGIVDIDMILDIYKVAARFMHDTGNRSQWIDGYPSEDLILNDIMKETQYVCICGNQTVGTFHFSVGDDTTYSEIYDGEWLNGKPYGVVHRLASNGRHRGIAHFCLQWCFERCGNIRVDTHHDNAIMQNILKKEGYVQCGVILTHNSTERLAFQKCRDI